MCQRPEGGGHQAQRTGPEPAFLETGASLFMKASHCWLSQHLLQIVHLSALLLKTLQCLPDSGVKCSFFPSEPRAPARSARGLTRLRPASGPLHWLYLGRVSMLALTGCRPVYSRDSVSALVWPLLSSLVTWPLTHQFHPPDWNSGLVCSLLCPPGQVPSTL